MDVFKEHINKRFEMKDLGLLTYYLGIKVSQHKGGITLKQEAYAKNILAKTNMDEYNLTKCWMENKSQPTRGENGEFVNPNDYRRVVDGLRYLIHTHPNLSFAVGVVSCFIEKPATKHL